MVMISSRKFILHPTLSVAIKAALFYCLKKLYKLRLGVFVFLKSLIDMNDLVSEIGPSMLATLIYRSFRYTKFGERNKTFSTVAAGLAFFSTSRESTGKLVASYLASCSIFQVLTSWDRLNDSRKFDRVKKTIGLNKKYKPST